MSRFRLNGCLACCAVMLFTLPSLGAQAPKPTKMTKQSRATSSQPATTAQKASRRDRGEKHSRRADHHAKAHRKHGHDRKQKAKIDSLDAELRHDGCFWIVEIEFKVKLEGFDSDEPFVLALDLTEDGKPVLSDKGEPFLASIQLDQPSKVKKNKREFKGRIQMRVHKDWVHDDDDLKVNASLVRAADGRVFDDEDESADLDRPGPTLHIGICGIGISIPL